MLFLQQGSDTTLRISNGTLFHSFTADTKTRFLWGTGTYNNIYVGIMSIARVTIITYFLVSVSRDKNTQHSTALI